MTINDDQRPNEAARPRVGIALGAGGAKGVGHVPMLEAFDEMGIVPHRIAGCSIGAVIGALYASGLTASDLRDTIGDLFVAQGETMRRMFLDRKINKWLGMIDPSFRGSGLIKSETIMASLCRDRACETFEELMIPFVAVATDFWSSESVVLASGPLKPAVQASMALPGLFSPVEIDGRVLIDGGTANPVPYNVLEDSCDIVVAIDINSGSAAEEGSMPGYFSTIFGSIQIMQQAIVDRELEAHPPDIYVKPELGDFRTLHFHKAADVYHQAQPAKEELKRRLEEHIEAWRATENDQQE